MTARDAVLADAFNSLLEILSRHELEGEAAAVTDAQSRATSAMPALARPPPSARRDAASEAVQLAEADVEQLAAREVAAIADERATSLTSYELGVELVRRR